ncbi:MAG: DUF4974 domain-containing protein [Cyclobacteriaceae bacterium]|nr:DUF4974 domain-containing protein [Cyclobacteriaceae bacterium]
MKKEHLTELLQKYVSGEATEDEKRTIEDWYDHFDQEDVSQEITEKFNPANKDRIFNQIISKTTPSQPTKSFQLPVFWYWAATVALLIVFSFALWHHLPGDAVEWQHKVTQAGQKSKFELPDGSLVYLNAGSKLSYPKEFSNTRRLVQLEGEAFFEVMHHPKKPFIVQTNSIETTVLGTAFNINAYANQAIKVTVASGRVAVGKLKAEKPWKELNANQQLTYLADEDEYMVNQVEIAEWISWKDGKLNLANRNLATILPELELWYGVSIVLINPALGNCQFQTVLHNQSLQSLLEEFAYAADINYNIKQDTVFLNGTGCK